MNDEETRRETDRIIKALPHPYFVDLCKLWSDRNKGGETNIDNFFLVQSVSARDDVNRQQRAEEITRIRQQTEEDRKLNSGND